MESNSTSGADAQGLGALVRSAIDSGRIGYPSFVRWTVRASGADGTYRLLDEALAAIAGWFGAPPGRIQRSGDVKGCGSALARWDTGQSAIVTVGPCLKGSVPSIDLMVLGSLGAIYHDGQAVRRRDLES